MHWKNLGILLLAGMMSFGAMSCATQEPIPQREMPANATFTGQWLTNFGMMKIKQMEDGTAQGSYDYRTGGLVEGTVTGGVFMFRWVQPGDFQVGRREVSGHAYFVISDDGQEVEGEWGYDKEYRGAGKWTGKKQNER